MPIYLDPPTTNRRPPANRTIAVLAPTAHHRLAARITYTRLRLHAVNCPNGCRLADHRVEYARRCNTGGRLALSYLAQDRADRARLLTT